LPAGFEGSSGNQSGDLLAITYSNDGGVTPNVTYGYDRRGRLLTALKNGMTTTFTYNDLDQVLTESYSGGTLSGVTLTTGYDVLPQAYTLPEYHSEPWLYL